MTVSENVQTAAPAGFRISLPPGWSRYLVDDEGKRALIHKTSARMKALGRPDLDAEARTLVEVQWRRLLASRVSAVYLPGETEEVLPPASIAARQYVAEPGADFHTSVRALSKNIAETIETPYGPVTRWESDEQGEGDFASIRTRRLGYGFGLPGENVRRGMVFFASIPYPDDADPLMVSALTELVDTVMETFRWN